MRAALPSRPGWLRRAAAHLQAAAARFIERRLELSLFAAATLLFVACAGLSLRGGILGIALAAGLAALWPRHAGPARQRRGDEHHAA